MFSSFKFYLGNYGSAVKYSNHINMHIEDELRHQAISGPYDEQSLNLHVSAFMAHVKPNSDKGHVVP